MKKITLFFALIFCGFQLAQAQTTLEVGADKTYTSIGAAWDAAKTETAIDIIINVAEGTYVETSNMKGGDETAKVGGKKITIRGAGADKTIVKCSDMTDFAINSTKNPGRLFQFNDANAANLELTLEKMSFETMGFMNTNGGGVVNTNQEGIKISFKDCNFKNIFARAGAIIQVTAQPIEVALDNCFIEECGSFDNNSHEGLIKVVSGKLSLTNCTFYNNSFDVLNRGNKSTGTDRDLKTGQLVTVGGSLSSFAMLECNFLNNKYINGDLDKIHPFVSMKPDTIGTAPGIVLRNAAPGFNIVNTISLGNVRTGSLDSDLYYNVLSVPTISGSVMNVVKNFDLNTSLDENVTSLEGVTINPDAAVSNYFEMEGDAPKIITNSLGVKSVVRKTAGVNNVNNSDLFIRINNGLLTITSDKLQNIEIFNSIGAKVGQFLNTNNVSVNLLEGIYIVKSETFSRKVLVR